MSFEFTPGEYSLRDGTRAVVLSVDAPSVYPIVGYSIDEDGVACVEEWTASGSYYSEDDWSNFDLMPPGSTPVHEDALYLNIYEPSFDGWMLGALKPSRYEADLGASAHPTLNRIACIRVVKGRFDD